MKFHLPQKHANTETEFFFLEQDIFSLYSGREGAEATLSYFGRRMV
jgi:hypothetical protein